MKQENKQSHASLPPSVGGSENPLSLVGWDWSFSCDSSMSVVAAEEGCCG